MYIFVRDIKCRYSNLLLHIFLPLFFFLSTFFLSHTLFQIFQMPSACKLPNKKKTKNKKFKPKLKKKRISVYFADRKLALSYEQKNAFRWLLNTAPHSPRRQKLNLRMKSLSLDSPESSELHGNMKRRYPLTGATHFNMQGGSAGLLDHNTPTSNNSRLHCKENVIYHQICHSYLHFVSAILNSIFFSFSISFSILSFANLSRACTLSFSLFFSDECSTVEPVDG